ncbi:50S ribosomal protein L23 [Candidatus Rubidus massiliensis]|nr:MAG: 50S ribosomal protein L23 [Chlamydia sp. 32-24]CDZ80464.1 50S ribosomal protein L23 [Candidatus Rubidus massiliensis]
MTQKNPYNIIKHQHITEKARTLQELKLANSNKSLSRFELPKYVFVVDSNANKQEIAQAIEEIYSDKQVKVVSVNTINVKAKARRVRGRKGKTAAFKKAIVTFEKGDSLDNV